MIYFDSSALKKLIGPEPESEVLSAWVRGNEEQPRATSAVARVEVLREFRASGPAAEDLASIVVSKLEQLPVLQEVLERAGEFDAALGAMDAIHLASACGVGERLHTFVSYDPAVLEAAEKAGLVTASPGAEIG